MDVLEVPPRAPAEVVPRREDLRVRPGVRHVVARVLAARVLLVLAVERRGHLHRRHLRGAVAPGRVVAALRLAVHARRVVHRALRAELLVGLPPLAHLAVLVHVARVAVRERQRVADAVLHGVLQLRGGVVALPALREVALLEAHELLRPPHLHADRRVVRLDEPPRLLGHAHAVAVAPHEHALRELRPHVDAVVQPVLRVEQPHEAVVPRERALDVPDEVVVAAHRAAEHEAREDVQVACLRPLEGPDARDLPQDGPEERERRGAGPVVPAQEALLVEPLEHAEVDHGVRHLPPRPELRVEHRVQLRGGGAPHDAVEGELRGEPRLDVEVRHVPREDALAALDEGEARRERVWDRLPGGVVPVRRGDGALRDGVGKRALERLEQRRVDRGDVLLVALVRLDAAREGRRVRAEGAPAAAGAVVRPLLALEVVRVEVGVPLALLRHLDAGGLGDGRRGPEELRVEGVEQGERELGVAGGAHRGAHAAVDVARRVEAVAVDEVHVRVVVEVLLPLGEVEELLARQRERHARDRLRVGLAVREEGLLGAVAVPAGEGVRRVAGEGAEAEVARDELVVGPRLLALHDLPDVVGHVVLAAAHEGLHRGEVVDVLRVEVLDEHDEEPVDGLVRRVVRAAVRRLDAAEVEVEQVAVVLGGPRDHGVVLVLPAVLLAVHERVGVGAAVPRGQAFALAGQHRAHLGPVGVCGVLEEAKVGVGEHGHRVGVGVGADAADCGPLGAVEAETVE